MQELARLAFIERAENVVLLGPSGVGKTHLALALAYRAMMARHQDALHHGGRPDAAARHRQGAGRLKEYFNRAILGPKLLVVDELGYLPFGRDEANLFFTRGGQALRARLHDPDQQPAVHAVGHGARRRRDADRRAARSAAAPRAYRADQRRELPAQGQAPSGARSSGELTGRRAPSPLRATPSAAKARRTGQVGGYLLLRRPGEKVGYFYFGVDKVGFWPIACITDIEPT